MDRGILTYPIITAFGNRLKARICADVETLGERLLDDGALHVPIIRAEPPLYPREFELGGYCDATMCNIPVIYQVRLKIPQHLLEERPRDIFSVHVLHDESARIAPKMFSRHDGYVPDVYCYALDSRKSGIVPVSREPLMMMRDDVFEGLDCADVEYARDFRSLLSHYGWLRFTDRLQVKRGKRTLLDSHVGELIERQHGRVQFVEHISEAWDRDLNRILDVPSRTY